MMDADGMSRALLCPSPALQDGPQQLKVHAKLGSFVIPSPGDGAGGVQHEPSEAPKGPSPPRDMLGILEAGRQKTVSLCVFMSCVLNCI